VPGSALLVDGDAIGVDHVAGIAGERRAADGGRTLAGVGLREVQAVAGVVLEPAAAHRKVQAAVAGFLELDAVVAVRGGKHAGEIRVDAARVVLGHLDALVGRPGTSRARFRRGTACARAQRVYAGDRTFEILGQAGLRSIPDADRAEFWTHPTGRPDRALDHVLFSRHWAVESYRVLRDFTLSDHLPVEAALRLRPSSDTPR
jgi:hypothetical protein